MPRRLLLAFSALVVVVNAWSEDAKRPCTLQALTSDCRFFTDAPGPEIPGPNGTRFLNLSIQESEAKGAPSDYELRELARIEQRVQISQLLNEIPESRLSTRFKIALIESPETLRKSILNENKDGARLPWPPTDPAAKIRPVTPSELAAAGLFTSEELKRLEAIVPVQQIIKDDNVTAEVITKMSSVDPERLARMSSLVKFVRETLIATIKGDTPEGRLTEGQRSAIRKIETITYVNPTDPVVDGNSACAGKTGNAYYEARTHTFTLCPNMLSYPDAALVQVMAHELAHSIDSCNGVAPLYRVNHKRLVELRNTDNQNALTLDEKLFVGTYLKDFPPNAEYVNLDYDPYFQDPRTARMLIEKGVLQEIVAPLPPEKHAFNRAIQCLASPQTGIRTTKNESDRFLAEWRAEMRARGSKTTASDERRLRQILERHGHCLNTDRGNQMTEASSDWASSFVLGR
ncbi:MAG TPA: hypothetical protein VFV50_06610, partial [Bdellovibrionales bacterium]|nr:hypothetical protein [Bdellovibrionales bacterium]